MFGEDGMAEAVDAAWFVEKIGERSATGIALEVRALIRTGLLPVGGKLPSVRDLAEAMGVSPATISAAWSELRRQRILTGRGRTGMWVSGDNSISGPTRFASIGNFGPGVLDLSLATPDEDLLPPLTAALAHGAKAEGLNSYVRVTILPELEAAVRTFWPYEPEAFLATNGGYSAIYTLLNAMAIHGARIAIEMPTALRHLDILEDLGAVILPVACDAEGPEPASLRAALAEKPVLFLFQPRLHSVTGRTVSPARLGALAEILRGSDTIIVEDDGLGAISAAAPQSLGALFPERVVHVHSFSKPYGPDLRIAVLSGPRVLIDQMRGYRSFSSGWTSRILQAATAWLIRDEATQETIRQARELYHERRFALADRLTARGIPIEPGHGLCLWVPVRSESYAVVTLAARGIAVAPGARFTVGRANRIRVSSGFVREGYDRIAEALRLAAADPSAP
jgi:DNA-binding transcriptional MocR family regulator